MAVYVCAELEKISNIYGGYDCKMWVLQQSSPMQDLAITGQQAIALSTIVITMFMSVFFYKIVKKTLYFI